MKIFMRPEEMSEIMSKNVTIDIGDQARSEVVESIAIIVENLTTRTTVAIMEKLVESFFDKLSESSPGLIKVRKEAATMLMASVAEVAKEILSGRSLDFSEAVYENGKET